MANCSNCYNGCTEIVSDKCVMYTGVDVPVLGIKKGDSLSYVEQALLTFTTSLIDGSGIKLDIDEGLYCSLVSDYLQACSTVTALDLFKALIQAACSLQTQVTATNAILTTLNADYDVECLDGVSASDDTHTILQAVITKLCAVDTTLTALALDLDTNYVKLSELNALIQAYIDSTAVSTKYFNKMVPYTVVEYYGSLSNFDATGAGLGDWEDIYLCNGLNGTPDKRGRVPVGAIVSVPGGPLASAVNPASSPFNPNYAVGDVAGVNSVTLDLTQIPNHNHTLTDPGHTHVLAKSQVVTGNDIAADEYLATERSPIGDGDYILQGTASAPDVGKVASSSTGVSIAAAGGGLPHSNTQPVIACYYIMYIP